MRTCGGESDGEEDPVQEDLMDGGSDGWTENQKKRELD